jgi:hypothetical protein
MSANTSIADMAHPAFASVPEALLARADKVIE